jgi:hypothetical protein
MVSGFHSCSGCALHAVRKRFTPCTHSSSSQAHYQNLHTCCQDE